MTSLRTAVADTRGWSLAARVDLRRGEIVERCSAPGGSGIESEDDVLLAAIEMLRSPERPRQVFVLAQKHVHLYERSSSSPNAAVVLVAGRTTNLGHLLASLRTITAAVDP